MQRIFKAISIFLFVTILLISCGGMPKTPMSEPTATFKPTRTPSSTPVSSPTPTATATLSQAEIIFTIPTHQTGDYPNTPTPIATPGMNASSMRLKNLTEENLLYLIDEMNQYSIQNFPSYEDWWSNGQFISSQEPVALAIQEYLYRFPDSENADRLRWQLAFINSILYAEGLAGNAYDSQWMLADLENKLNRGEVPPDELETVLDRYWFEVAHWQPIENLFGDGRTAWLYVISPQVWQEEEHYLKSGLNFGRGGLFAIVQELDDHKFKIHLLANDWNFINGSDSIFEISDHNKNGVPEIALNLWRHGGTMCAGNFKIFEWREDRFKDLTNGEISIFDCADNYEYSVVNGKPAILWRRIPKKSASVLTWNGSIYEHSGYQFSNLVEKWSYASTSSEEAHVLEEILASNDREGLTFSQVDFLRYRLGIVYALNGDVSQARRVLQDLADYPLDTTRTLYSEFAKNFRRYYSGDQNLFLACKKSGEMFARMSSPSAEKTDEELFGFSFDRTFGPGLLVCHAGEVFENLTNRMPVTVNNVAGELRKNGMKLYYAQKRDVNLDGLADEWLIISDDGIYAVFREGASYRAMQIEYFWGADPSKYSNADLKIERWNGIKDPVLIVSTENELNIYSVGQDFMTTWLDVEYDMDKILFSPQSSPAQFQVFYLYPSQEVEYFDVPWSGYRWDSTDQVFRKDLLEYILFVERDPDKAVELVKSILPHFMDWKELDAVSYTMPRLFYLCGLTFELSGDEQKATEIYWQLWHDFPESHYARMAEYKLEPNNP